MKVVLVSAALVIALVFANASEAAVFTNGTSASASSLRNGQLQIQFHCDVFCMGEWYLQTGQSVSKPNLGGRFWADIDTDYVYGPWPSACERPDALGGDDDHPPISKNGTATFAWGGQGDDYYWQIVDPLPGKYAINWGVVSAVEVGYQCVPMPSSQRTP